ncbi:MAG: 2-amino-4-hydroxy-6-hydroxymethyldihydropteridine diphosphokinase [Actinomycetota bacterium]
MTTAYIGIGSNVGERSTFCRRAVSALDDTPEIRVTATSSLYETTPVGGPPQRSFINLVARLETGLGPRTLLGVCKEIERMLGREPSNIRWGPRVVDLDLLTFGEEKINDEDLEVPHPRMLRRKFVLVPLLEIDPDAADPWGARYSDWVDEAEGEVLPVELF